MNDLRKAAEMALEALEKLRFANAPFLDEAIQALRTALAHPKQRGTKKLKVTLVDRPIDVELAQYKRMFEAACSALGAIGDALGVDPEEGGAEPILAAIEEIKTAQSKQKPAVYKCPRCATSMDVDLNAKPVDTINTSHERVDETAKREHEPVAWYGTDFEGNPTKFRLNYFAGSLPLYPAPPISDYHEGWEEGFKAAKGEHEPVGFFSINDYGNWEENENGYGEPLYTAPPKREWVGLTDDEIDEVAGNVGYGYIDVAKAIEAKLKEKNFKGEANE